ncbi:hypothetical protein PIB30_035484 [Stylosanthes scabra]|uniref:Transmembrane protein n=1 Tax=Stylosanthes scabra TaxID=79078 RepID=A0ABU6WB66_9FABA|nr:hypothetical protein [Stylosanthes scabra]
MGGGGASDHGHGPHGGDFRSKVWSMTGGPYCRPKHWRRNTAIAMFGVFLLCVPIAMKSAELEGESWDSTDYSKAGEISSYRRPVEDPIRRVD